MSLSPWSNMGWLLIAKKKTKINYGLSQSSVIVCRQYCMVFWITLYWGARFIKEMETKISVQNILNSFLLAMCLKFDQILLKIEEKCLGIWKNSIKRYQNGQIHERFWWAQENFQRVSKHQIFINRAAPKPMCLLQVMECSKNAFWHL